MDVKALSVIYKDKNQEKNIVLLTKSAGCIQITSFVDPLPLSLHKREAVRNQ